LSDPLKHHPNAARFNRLTPDQVLHAVQARGKRCTGRFIILNSFENRVYQLEMEDETWVVGKFYRPGRWSRDTILDEHRFLKELEELEIPVACPLEITAGETLGEVEEILYALFPRIGGRAPEELVDEQIQVLGRLIARIHNAGSSADAPHRKRLTPKTYGEENLRYLMESKAVPEEARDVYAKTVAMLLSRIEDRFADVPMHRIHGDCHLGNLLWTTRGPTFLDFDDMLVGPAVQDIWMMLPSFDAEGQRQREVMLKAYREFREFDHAWLRLIEPLRALRFIHYSTWIARRWDDPVFKRTWSYFGTVQYWQKEIQDLQEQIARIANEGIPQGWN